MSDNELGFYLWIVSLFTDTFTGKLILILFALITSWHLIVFLYRVKKIHRERRWLDG